MLALLATGYEGRSAAYARGRFGSSAEPVTGPDDTEGVKMGRRIVIGVAALLAISAGLASSASAANLQLVLDQGSAFAVLGHSCGGIQEKVYVRGFAANGYPQGNVEMSTRCGGSGRGGGGGTTEYKGTASVVWTWFAETRSHGTLSGPLEAKEATDAHGDRVYNTGTNAYLEKGTPPLQPPAPPTITGTSIILSDEPPEDLRLTVSWTVDPETARLLKSETATATPSVGPPPPVLSATVSPYFSSAVLHPLETNTTYKVTVNATDAEGTSEASKAVEVKSPNSDGEAEKGTTKAEACAANGGKIKLKPGLTETPAVQSIAITGEMSGCSGPQGFSSGKYKAQLATTEAVTCSVLSGAALEGTSSHSFSIKWLPAEGSSTGSLLLPLSEAPLTGLTATLSGGPFAALTKITAASVSESFTGGASCGQAVGRHKAKPVKSGTFITGQVEFA
jgi:hypothetical protein